MVLFRRFRKQDDKNNDHESESVGGDVNAQELVRKGENLRHQRRYDEAIACFDRALEINPQLEEARKAKFYAWTNMGRNLKDSGRFHEASRCYDQALEINPQDADALEFKVFCLRRLGRLDEAINCLDRALEINPQLEDALSGCRMVTLCCFGQFDETIEFCRKEIERNPRNWEAWFYKGKSLQSLGHSDEAVKCFDKALEINPKNMVAWYNRRLATGGLRPIEETINPHELVRTNPQEAVRLVEKGFNFEMRFHNDSDLGNLDEALRCFDEALKFNPQCAEAWYGKGELFYNCHAFEEAIKYLDKALEINPQYIAALRLKAIVEDLLR
jgi:tetratricopeptide (TPR) repeat protein